jgi:hypothetical protein
MKDLICLVVLVTIICCMHATNNKQLSQKEINIAQPRDSLFYYSWPGIQAENAGSRGIYRVGNKKHNPEHYKPRYYEEAN